jgi:hypothetical protein
MFRANRLVDSRTFFVGVNGFESVILHVLQRMCLKFGCYRRFTDDGLRSFEVT